MVDRSPISGGQVPRPPAHRNPPPTSMSPIPGRPPPHLPPSFRPTKRGASCCKICCCCFLVTFLLILLLLTVAGGLIYLYHPKPPSFRIQSCKISAVHVAAKPEGTYFSAAVSAAIQLTNPNEKMMYRYGETYVGITVGDEKDTDMGSTTLPGFEQAGLTTTTLKVETSVKDELLDKREEERLPKQYEDKSLKVNLEVTTTVGIETMGLKIGMLNVAASCQGMTLKDIQSGNASPDCTIRTLHNLDHCTY
ncbi:unnamed protein product [Linum tenue]|uniref:Late embryogenesis abundant protein LEA-2 subgroup domain-containing protein n=1 Tax=Linum tenue TaxID=586396 RepID=A0AAV0PGC2_9ROSI|nr:unnamed protein product [Linum tenue]